MSLGQRYLVLFFSSHSSKACAHTFFERFWMSANVPCYLTNPNGKSIHLHGGDDANGAKITLWAKEERDLFQWHFVPDEKEEGYFKITNGKSGRVLHNHGEKNANGNPITTWEASNPSEALKMKLQPGDKNGYWNIVNKQNGKCVHNHGNASNNGNPITQWDKIDKHDALIWKIEIA